VGLSPSARSVSGEIGASLQAARVPSNPTAAIQRVSAVAESRQVDVVNRVVRMVCLVWLSVALP